METIHGGINSLFWEKRPFKDGGCFYYSPNLGEMRMESPPTMHGGLLCDEMGLGKTLELLALITSSRGRVGEEVGERRVSSRATLIVVPPALLPQWINEIGKSIAPEAGLTHTR